MKGWGALAKWAPFFDDAGASPVPWAPGGGGGGGGGAFTIVNVPFDFNDTPVSRVIHTLLAGQVLFGVIDYVTVAFNGDPLTSNHIGIAADINRYLNDNITGAVPAVGTVEPANDRNTVIADLALADTPILLSVDNSAGGPSGSTAGTGSVVLLIGTP